MVTNNLTAVARPTTSRIGKAFTVDYEPVAVPVPPLRIFADAATSVQRGVGPHRHPVTKGMKAARKYAKQSLAALVR